MVFIQEAVIIQLFVAWIKDTNDTRNYINGIKNYKNGNTRTICEICSKLTITHKYNVWRRSTVFIVNLLIEVLIQIRIFVAFGDEKMYLS